MRQPFGQCVKRSFSQAWRDTFWNVRQARDFDALVNAFMLWSQSKSYKICARFLDKYFIDLNARLRRAFLSFDLSRDRAQVFCVFKNKIFSLHRRSRRWTSANARMGNFWIAPYLPHLKPSPKIDRASGVRASRTRCAPRWNVCAVAQTWNTAVVWPPCEILAHRASVKCCLRQRYGSALSSRAFSVPRSLCGAAHLTSRSAHFRPFAPCVACIPAGKRRSTRRKIFENRSPDTSWLCLSNRSFLV